MSEYDAMAIVVSKIQVGRVAVDHGHRLGGWEQERLERPPYRNMLTGNWLVKCVKCGAIFRVYRNGNTNLSEMTGCKL